MNRLVINLLLSLFLNGRASLLPADVGLLDVSRDFGPLAGDLHAHVPAKAKVVKGT